MSRPVFTTIRFTYRWEDFGIEVPSRAALRELYDRFRGRVIVPVLKHGNIVIGFDGLGVRK
jgi:hypothetical protein